jgi:hypothetical protein
VGWARLHRGRARGRAEISYQAALDALKTNDLAGYNQHLQKMVADLRQADQLEHGSATPASGGSPIPSPTG